MDDQTTLDNSYRQDPSAHAVLHNLAHLGQHVLSLAGLQCQLFASDLRDLWRNVIRAMLFWALACVVMLAVLPTALVGMGLWLSYATSWPSFVGLLIVALAGLVLATVFMAVGAYLLRQQRDGLNRSSAELQSNLATLRRALSNYADCRAWD